MTPSKKLAPDPSTAYVESFIPELGAAVQARRSSQDLGLEPVSAATAQVLTVLTRLISASNVVEIGTGAGVSALAFFAGMTADGILTSIDSEAEHQVVAREALKATGVSHTRYRLITGEAIEVLSRLRAGAYDIVFVDGEPLEYPEYLEEGLRIVRPGGLLILNRALLSGKVGDPTNFDDDTMQIRDTLEAARDLDNLTTALIPVGDGLLVSVVNADSD